MKPRINSTRILTILLVLVIVLLGSFRDSILNWLINAFDDLEFQELDNWLTDFIMIYGSTKSMSQWIANYFVFYPIYLGCHFMLVNLLFKDFPKASYWLNLSLILILIILIFGKVLFGIFNVPILAEYFSFAFHKLIALPFLLLVIEGGRSIYKLIDEY